MEPHPLFSAFIAAARKHRAHRIAQQEAPLLPEPEFAE
jgi:hypothetical protein